MYKKALIRIKLIRQFVLNPDKSFYVRELQILVLVRRKTEQGLEYKI